ncbi:MAG: group II intron maturase-specific domain-containing protein [Gemmatimonadales bacterium]
MVARKTAKVRFSGALKRVAQWCRTQRHRPVAEQQAKLSQKLRGHYAYYGITGNAKALARFRYEVERRWRYWLSRRSSHGSIAWRDFGPLLRRHPLPPPRVVHSIYRHAATP